MTRNFDEVANFVLAGRTGRAGMSRAISSMKSKSQSSSAEMLGSGKRVPFFILTNLAARRTPTFFVDGGAAAIRTIDFLVKVEDKIALLEVKYKLPSRAGDALTRLVSQMQLAAASGQGQVVLFTFKEPAAKDIERVYTALGAAAPSVQMVFGFHGLAQWFNFYFH